MRAIKFRAWDGVDYMSTPFTFQDIMLKKVGFTKDVVIMQFTGIKDRKGREIYEGDIISSGKTQTGKLLAWVVEYYFDGFKILDVNPTKHKKRKPSATSHYFWESTTVIGNIYQNPNLLTPQTR